MKIIKFLFFIILSLILFSTGVFIILIKTFDMNRFKTVLSNKAEETIGQEVTIGEMDFVFSFSDGLLLEADKVQIENDPMFAHEPALLINKIQMRIGSINFLTKREIQISSILLKEPKVFLIRNKQGRYNVSPQEQDTVTQTEPGRTNNIFRNGKDQSESQFDQKLPQFLVETIQIENGWLKYHDLMGEKPIVFEVNRINLDIDQFSIEEAFDFRLQCSLLSSQDNLEFHGKAYLDIPHQQARFDDIQIKFDLSTLSLPLLKKALPIFESLQEEMKGRFDAWVNQIVIGQEGLKLLSLEGQFFDGQIVHNPLREPVKEIHFQYDIGEQDVEIVTFTGKLGNGRIEANGGVDNFLDILNSKYSVELNAQEIPLDSFKLEFDPDVEFQGILNSDFKVKGKGLKNFESILQTLNGLGNVSVKDGHILHLNLLELILNQIPFTEHLKSDRSFSRLKDDSSTFAKYRSTGLAGDLLNGNGGSGFQASHLERNLPPKIYEIFQREDTSFDSAILNFRIEKGQIYFDKAQLITQDFMLEGQGNIDWERKVELNSVLITGEVLSEYLVDEIREFEALKQDDGRLRIPLTKYEGPLDQLKLHPDLKKLSREILKGTLGDELKKALGEYLEEEDQQAGGEESQQQDGEQEQQVPETSPVDDLLDKVFDQIFE